MSENTSQPSRRGIAIAMVLISVPLLVALVEAATFYADQRSNGTIVSSNQRRSYLLHVPRTYDPAKPTPLVISLHAAAVWPAVQRDISQWNAVADEHGFIVVYPSGVGGARPRVWRVNHGPGLMTDVRFIADLIDTLQASYNIDPARVYADGLSNGAGMAFVLSCTLSDRIAAVGMVASALLLPFDWCTDQRPVPVMAFHGTADPVTPYHGGLSWVANDVFPAVPSFAASWARRNGCAPTASDVAVAAGVMRREYAHCAAGAPVVLYTIEGGGHTWPGGQPVPEWFAGVTSDRIDATREMWSFFRAHPRRAP
jgi:polyhydroxybutyrate depolymerase